MPPAGVAERAAAVAAVAPAAVAPKVAPETGPWPGLKAIIVVDLTPPEVRPVDLEVTTDKALRSALLSPGRFHSALAADAAALLAFKYSGDRFACARRSGGRACRATCR